MVELLQKTIKIHYSAQRLYCHPSSDRIFRNIHTLSYTKLLKKLRHFVRNSSATLRDQNVYMNK